jgi:glycerol-3-phosphate responsive antiterminator
MFVREILFVLQKDIPRFLQKFRMELPKIMFLFHAHLVEGVEKLTNGIEFVIDKISAFGRCLPTAEAYGSHMSQQTAVSVSASWGWA